jgi:hypothetical protein
LRSRAALASVLPYYRLRPRSESASISFLKRHRMEDAVIERNKTSKTRVSRHVIRGRGVFTLMFWIALAAPVAMAQQPIDTVTETVTTRRDLNGRDVVSKKVVTQRARTNDEERVVIETYSPLEYADRLELNRRVRRVTTVTEDGSQIVEETEERNPGSPSEPLRIVQRSVTTLRRSGSGSDSYVSERQIFEPDGNGRLVLVRKRSGQTSP